MHCRWSLTIFPIPSSQFSTAEKLDASIFSFLTHYSVHFNETLLYHATTAVLTKVARDFPFTKPTGYLLVLITFNLIAPYDIVDYALLEILILAPRILYWLPFWQFFSSLFWWLLFPFLTWISFGFCWCILLRAELCPLPNSYVDALILVH